MKKLTLPDVGSFWRRPGAKQTVRVLAIVEKRYVVARYIGCFPFLEDAKTFCRNVQPCPPAKSHSAANEAAQVNVSSS